MQPPTFLPRHQTIRLMGKKRRTKRAAPSRDVTDDAVPATSHSPLVEWLNAQPPLFYLGAAIAFAFLVAVFVISLTPVMLEIVACVAFTGLLVWWVRKAIREWRDDDTLARAASAFGVLLLLGTLAARAVRLFVLAAS
jgi:hypothetical protein